MCSPNKLKMINKEPTLCTTKYNIESFFLGPMVTNGRNDKVFTSNITHALGHASVEIEPKVPNKIPVHIHSVQTTIISFKQ